MVIESNLNTDRINVTVKNAVNVNGERTLYVAGDLVGVIVGEHEAGELAALRLTGIYDVTLKDGDKNVTVGTKLYVDPNTLTQVTTTSSGSNVFAGHAISDVDNTGTGRVVRLRLKGA